MIGWGAFQDCTSLKSITIPKSITEIHAYAFNECSALSTIYVPAMKADYYKKRLPEKLHDKIVEIEPVLTMRCTSQYESKCGCPKTNSRQA